MRLRPPTSVATKEIESTLMSEQVVYELAQGSALAFLEDEHEILYVRDSNPKRGRPYSPVVDLIQGIYALDPKIALKRLRNRIYTNYNLTPMCLGMIRVAARKYRSNVLPHDHGVIISKPKHHLESTSSATAPRRNQEFVFLKTKPEHKDFLQFATELALHIPRSQPRYASDRSIAAVLVSAEGSILEVATNQNAINKTWHAELNLVQSFWSRTHAPIPKGSTLYTTLKPCRMCAGMLWNCVEDLNDFHVFYAEDDPGPNGRQTVLTLNTPERKEACAHHPEYLSLRLETHLPLSDTREPARKS